MGHDLFQTDLDLMLLRHRLDRLIDAMGIKAMIDIDRKAEYARRSTGQRFRRAREDLIGVNHGYE